MIIGITGPICAGKDVAGALFADLGFERLSLVEELRAELRKQGTEITRKSLQDEGDRLRRDAGADVLARRVMSKIVADKHYVIESIRNPGEVAALRELPDFMLLCVTAPDNVRFERMVARGREQDPQTFEAFLQIEARDRGIGQASHAQQNEACWKLADVTLVNDTTVDALRERVKSLIDERSLTIQQPVHIITAVPSESSARDLARSLVEQRAAACVQIIPSQSFYWWNGKLQEVAEWLCLVKGRDFGALERAIKEHHPYEVPEILQFSIEKGNSDYVRWLMKETL